MGMRTLKLLSGLLICALAGCQQTKLADSKESVCDAEMPAEKAPAVAQKAPEVAPTTPAVAPAPKYASFGAAAKLSDADAIPVEKVMAAPDEYKGKFVRLTGTVDKVCPNKGCWLTLKGPGDGEALLVKFPDPDQGRLIPMAAVGKPAIVEGTVRVREIPEETAKHFAEESGATPEQLAKITGPQKQITVASPCAMVADVKSGQEQVK
jgi:hypothetical protein